MNRAIEAFLLIVGFVIGLGIFIHRVRRDVEKMCSINNNENQNSPSKHQICEHGRNAFVDDCGMCDMAGTNYAKEDK